MLKKLLFIDNKVMTLNSGETITIKTLDGITSITKGVDSNGNEYSACTVSGNMGFHSVLGTRGVNGSCGMCKNYKKPHHIKRRKNYE